MPEKEYFAKNMKRFRELNHLTQFEAGEDMGLSKDTISKIERELTKPKMETVQKAAAYMGITVSDLLTDWNETNYEVPIIR